MPTERDTLDAITKGVRDAMPYLANEDLYIAIKGGAEEGLYISVADIGDAITQGVKNAMPSPEEILDAIRDGVREALKPPTHTFSADDNPGGPSGTKCPECRIGDPFSAEHLDGCKIGALIAARLRELDK